jgi:predicted RNA-binding protein with RPS1 domain
MLDSQLAAYEKFKSSSSQSRDSEARSRRSKLSNDPSLPRLNSIHQGRVVKIMEFGAFIQMVDVTQQGLVHRAQVSIIIADNMNKTYEALVTLAVYYTAVESQSGRSVGSILSYDLLVSSCYSYMTPLFPSFSADVVQVNDSVWVGGCSSHESTMKTSKYISNPILPQVKIVDIDEDDSGKVKIGLSMKYVNQGNGDDLGTYPISKGFASSCIANNTHNTNEQILAM